MIQQWDAPRELIYAQTANSAAAGRRLAARSCSLRARAAIRSLSACAAIVQDGLIANSQRNSTAVWERCGAQLWACKLGELLESRNLRVRAETVVLCN